MKKIILPILFISLVVALAWWSYQQLFVSVVMPDMTPEAVVVQTANAAERDIAVQINTVGSLTASNSVTISPEIAGLVTQVGFEDGQAVQQGQLLFQLDDRTLRGDHLATKANLELSTRDYQRASQLADTNAISKQGLDKARSDYQYKQAMAKIAKANLEKTTIKAPFAGVLEARKVSVGDFVQVGQPLVVITDLSQLKVSYHVAESYLAQLHHGQRIRLHTRAYPDEAFNGRVTFISHQINPQDRSLEVQAIVSNPEQKLRPGLYVTVSHQLGQEQHALTVPPESVLASLDGNYVYKIVDGKAVQVAVKVGRRGDDYVSILSGLIAGDQVVTLGHEKLRDGLSVAVQPNNLG